MKKIVILVPGIGYTVDRPLLYYSGKLANNLGYEVKKLYFSGFPKKVIGDRGRMEESFAIAAAQTQEQMKNIHPEEWDRIVFISKSIGTIVAAKFQKDHQIAADNIYFTPVADTFAFARPSSGIAFHGTADPWTADVSIEDECRKLNIPCVLIPNANHSLETGDIQTDIRAMENIMLTVESCLR